MTDTEHFSSRSAPLISILQKFTKYQPLGVKTPTKYVSVFTRNYEYFTVAGRIEFGGGTRGEVNFRNSPNVHVCTCGIAVTVVRDSFELDHSLRLFLSLSSTLPSILFVPFQFLMPFSRKRVRELGYTRASRRVASHRIVSRPHPSFECDSECTVQCRAECCVYWTRHSTAIAERCKRK